MRKVDFFHYLFPPVLPRFFYINIVQTGFYTQWANTIVRIKLFFVYIFEFATVFTILFRRFILSFSVLLCTVFAEAQTIREIGTINIQMSVVERDASARTVEFLSSKSQSAGKFRGANVASCLKELINKIAPDDRSKTIIIAKNNFGQKLVFSLPELLPEISKIPPILVYRRVVGDIGDTVHIGDVRGQTGRVNIQEIDKYLERATQERIKLQIPDVQRVTSFLRQPVSLIFPTDASSGRWLADVDSLTIAIIE